MNIHKTFRRRPGRLMYVQFTSCDCGKPWLFNLHSCQLLKKKIRDIFLKPMPVTMVGRWRKFASLKQPFPQFWELNVFQWKTAVLVPFIVDPTILQTQAHVNSKNYFFVLQVDSISYKRSSLPRSRGIFFVSRYCKQY